MRYRLVLLACFVTSTLLGQETRKEYCLHGVEDSLSYPVTIRQDLVNEIATFTIQGHAINIFGVQDIKHIKIHASAFLEVQFRIRGGSGVKVRRTVLLCASQGKIYKPLDVVSEVTSRLTKVYDKEADSLKIFDEKEDYHVGISIKRNEDNRYKAVLLESTKVESKYDPSQNKSFEKNYELNFDPGGYFFFNSTKHLNKRFKIYSSKDHKTTEKFIDAEVPCIQLYQNCYLFIDNEWCMSSGQDSLSCL